MLHDRAPMAAPSARQTGLSQVCVRKLKVAANIGVHAHEVGRRQTLIVHAVATLPPGGDDRLQTTFDYNLFVQFAEDLAQEHISLIETFASRLADRCLATGLVAGIDVTIEKPGALTNGIAAARVVRLSDAG